MLKISSECDLTNLNIKSNKHEPGQSIQRGRILALFLLYLAEATGPESRQPAGPVRMVSPASQHSNFKNLQQSLLIANIVIFGRFLKLLCWLAVLTMHLVLAADEIQDQSPQLDLYLPSFKGKNLTKWIWSDFLLFQMKSTKVYDIEPKVPKFSL